MRGLWYPLMPVTVLPEMVQTWKLEGGCMAIMACTARSDICVKLRWSTRNGTSTACATCRVQLGG